MILEYQSAPRAAKRKAKKAKEVKLRTHGFENFRNSISHMILKSQIGVLSFDDHKLIPSCRRARRKLLSLHVPRLFADALGG